MTEMLFSIPQWVSRLTLDLGALYHTRLFNDDIVQWKNINALWSGETDLRWRFMLGIDLLILIKFSCFEAWPGWRQPLETESIRLVDSFIHQDFIQRPHHGDYSGALQNTARLKKTVFSIKLVEWTLGNKELAKGSPFQSEGPTT